ncbi:MAG: hypothetical protein JSV08_03355 [Acidobacteriota bacterium]|nr:MAG: hypothetical protein JSV08_07490 [Acidobacteriota bacterium]UCF81459.1 MAG: hypothetical protein JSV08_03355 [Acidobacteriota bacterium]
MQASRLKTIPWVGALLCVLPFSCAVAEEISRAHYESFQGKEYHLKRNVTVIRGSKTLLFTFKFKTTRANTLLTAEGVYTRMPKEWRRMGKITGWFQKTKKIGKFYALPAGASHVQQVGVGRRAVRVVAVVNDKVRFGTFVRRSATRFSVRLFPQNPCFVEKGTYVSVHLEAENKEQFDAAFARLFSEAPLEETHGWSEEDKALVRERKLRVGMTRPMVWAALGEPTSKNLLVTEDGSVEKHRYAAFCGRGEYLVTFEGDTVASYEIPIE